MVQARESLAKSLGATELLLVMVLYSAPANAFTESMIHAFQDSDTDGYEPNAGLIYGHRTLFGTTTYGGGSGYCAGGCGTIFGIDPTTGDETILSSFNSIFNGFWPYAGLVKVKNTLYGTTMDGGNPNEGTIFAFDLKTGAETVLFAFSGGADGANPSAALVEVNGILFGTTVGGGANNAGTVFSFDPATNVEMVLHSFGGSDGSQPNAGLIEHKGMLYGTTAYGGDGASCTDPNGCGTVFGVDPASGAERVLYSFCKRKTCADGNNPTTRLLDVSGTLYGTTEYGGIGCGPGCGTVYSLNLRTGRERIAHYFSFDGTDGAYPEAGLINVGGILYGTTSNGGTNSLGTVFSLDPRTDAETVVYSFQGGDTDGARPDADLTNVSGTLYGTTWAGGGTGCSGRGCGAVFKLTP